MSSTVTSSRHPIATTSTSGLVIPSAGPSIGSTRIPDGHGSGQYQRQAEDRNQTPSQSSLPFPQSQLASDVSPMSDRSPFPPQENAKWGGRNNMAAADRFESGTPNLNQGQMSRQEAYAHIMEYHLARNKTSRDEERLVGDGAGDKRKRKRSDAEFGHEVEVGDRNASANGKGFSASSSTVQQQQQPQQQTFRQPSASTQSSTSAGPSTSMPTNNAHAQSSRQCGDDEDSPSPLPSSSTMNGNDGVQVYTVGHLMPRNTFVDDRSGNWNFDTSGGASASASKDVGNLSYGPAAITPDGASEGGGNEDDGDETVRPSPPTSTSTSTTGTSSQPTSSSSSSSASPSSSSSKKLRVRRATFVPSNWAVPPRVLLVDDDAVIRKLSSKFLKIFGCTTDVAVDGIGAVTKMNLEKYDLVLMDILMPKLDGISATNLIRKFDRGTPIISMTVNSKPNEIMEYYSSGMNDILPKPFTKEGLLVMLEKHLVHLKVMQQMTAIPRSVGVPPLSDANFEQVLVTNAMMIQQQQFQRYSGAAGLLDNGNMSDGLSTASIPLPPQLTLATPPPSLPQQQQQQQQQPSQFSFTSLLGMGEDDGRINPLAGMGLSDEQYSMILQNLVNGERFMGMGMDNMAGGGGVGNANNTAGNGGSGSGGGTKRTIDDVGFGGDERGGKRSRFEVIE